MNDYKVQMVCNDDGRIVIVTVKKMIILNDDNGGDSDVMIRL